MNIYRSRQMGTEGNLKGDGTILGAVYVIGRIRIMDRILVGSK